MNWSIRLSPQQSNLPALTLSVSGTTIHICGESLDLSPMSDGDVLSAEAVDNIYVVGDIAREGDNLLLTLLFPTRHTASDEARFPQPIFVSVDGPLTLPDIGKDPEE